MSTPKKSLPPRRKRDPRSMLRDSDSDSPKGRSFHAARSAVGYSRKHGSSHAARREKGKHFLFRKRKSVFVFTKMFLLSSLSFVLHCFHFFIHPSSFCFILFFYINFFRNVDEEVVELTPDMLAQLMGSLGVAQDQPDADGGVGPREVVFASSAANRQVLDEDWRVNVVQVGLPIALWCDSHGPQSKQSCVCKIISQIVDFDFEMPFKSADSASAIGTGFFVDVASAGGIFWKFVKIFHTFLCRKRRNCQTRQIHRHQRARGWLCRQGVDHYSSHRRRAVGCWSLWRLFRHRPGGVASAGRQHSSWRNIASGRTLCGRSDSVLCCSLALVQDSNKVRVGQSVIALGHPLGMNSLKLTEGKWFCHINTCQPMPRHH